MNRWVATSINNLVRIELTERGRDVLRKYYDDLASKLPELRDEIMAAMPSSDTEARITMQLWQTMAIFGPHMRMSDDLLFETAIEVEA